MKSEQEMFKMKHLHVSVCALLFICVTCVAETTKKPSNGICPINPTLSTDVDGNTYLCPKFNPDGTENTHTECCHNDRPDEEGNYHSCCQNDEDKSAEQNAAFYRMLAYIFSGTAVCIAIVIVFTYCKPDTFPCLKPLKRYAKRGFDLTMDAICFCPCLPNIKKTNFTSMNLSVSENKNRAERVNCQEKPCAKSGENGDIEADDNTYYCMATVNNQPSPYTRCCWTDRPVNSAGVYDPNGAERVNCQEKPCAKSGENGDIEADDNTYYCMATVNNQPSPYTRCCWTDRPVNSAGVYDPNGKTYSCCKEKDEAKKEMWKDFIYICVYVIIGTACLMSIVYVTTYCKVDTFPFLKPVRKKFAFWKNIMLDSICFCPCLPKKFRRKIHKKNKLSTPPVIKVAQDETQPNTTPVEEIGDGYAAVDIW
ncbi:uncharacterized protein LOC117101657 [Anneissia japonica]|uniref:uncharacterized protein LOC117101657 n=1 Tax=Anneissia japonica TaxID=1529436 RepID=UPI0014256B6A|nr:uncharacterized protein LOC117101657 [Anneissia japonica]